ncbi:DUF3352 domain-containing protein [Ornithinimicrobium sp. LYQ103]|uniref:DUF3352 domain-containing protein n=1 Tax=Ornithinimicrobium sp. LYQ103 TaxID=3378796 RepID=UPI003853DAB6
MSVISSSGDVVEARGGRGMVMAGAAVGAVLLIGGGAYAATQLLGGAGDQPDSVLPASAAAYVGVDVDPSVGQKVAAVRFFQGLDEETRARLDDGEWREWVWEQLQADGKTPEGVDFETDVEPWLGDRLGAVVIADGAAEPVAALALQVSDGEQAKETLDRLMAEQSTRPVEEQAAYYLDGDYVVFSSRTTIDQVRSEAEKGTLDDHDAYRSDMDDLGEAGIASMWVDAGRAGGMAAALEDAMVDGGVPSAGPGAGLLDDGDLLTGRTAATLRLSPDAIEVYGISRGADGLTMPVSEGADLVAELPADTAGALSLENGAAWAQTLWDHYATAHPDEVAAVVEEAAASGFTLPDDVMTVLGESMALSVGPGVAEALQTGSPASTGPLGLPIGYQVRTDAAAMSTLLTEAGPPLTMLPQRTDDGVLTIGVDQAYVDSLAAPEGALGQDATYRSAVADSEDASQVLFVDVNPFEEYYLQEVDDENAREALELLGALGFSTVVDSETESHFTLRFVADAG